MIFCAIETSTIYTVVAVGDQKRLLAGASRRLEKGRGERVGQMIASCLKKARVKLSDCDILGVGVGPGSFTGLRVGLSFVKGLSYSLNLPIVPFCSLDAIAANRPSQEEGRLAVVVDARRSNIYRRFYNAGIPEGQPVMVEAASWLKMKWSPLSLRGDALAVHGKEFLHKAGIKKPSFQRTWYPSPASVAECVRREWAHRKVTDSFGLEAVYFYDSDCQVKK